MGRSHVEVFCKHCANEAEGVALFDPHESSRARALEILPKAKVCDSAQALIESEVDAVVISSPNCTHADCATAALAAGKHVFAEKPVATTAADCRRMVEAANKSDRILFIGHELRYSTYFQKIKELIAQGAIGTVQMVWCKEFRPPFLPKVNNWIIDERYSGGAMVDKNGHHFDLMNWWVGSRPRHVSAFGCKRFNNVIGGDTEVIDNASVSFEYKNGVVGTLLLCMFAPDRGEDCLEMGVMGDKGMLQTRMNEHTITVWPRDKKREVEAIKIEAETDGFGGHVGFVEEHKAFLAAIRNGTRPLTDVRECVSATLLAIAAERAIKQGSVVAVEKV